MAIISFEERSNDIAKEIEKRRSKWYLNSISYIDYDDVSQIIFAHVYDKWHLWDQSMPLEPWLNSVISNQIKNITRNNYGNFARPCINCPFNEGYDNNINLCGFTSSGEQCSECALYAKWENSKKNAYNIKVPVSYDYHSHEIKEHKNNSTSSDINDGIQRIHKAMRKRLNDKHYRVYEMLFIENTSEEEVAKFMGYKTGEKNRKAGYKQIRNLKMKFKSLAEQILLEEDILYI